MIFTIFRKDLVDAIRDGRVAIAIVVPILIGVLYGHIFPSTTDPGTPSYTLAVYAQDPSTLPDALVAIGGDSVTLSIRTMTSEDALKDRVSNGNADLGIVIPAGFDAAVAAGQHPVLPVFVPPTTTGGTSYLLAALDPTLRQMAGQEPPATVRVSATAEPEESRFDRLGLKNYMLTFSLTFLIGMIAMLAIPIILTEEIEKKTLDALTMVASYGDVIIGKALVGLVYTIVAGVITLVLAGAHVGNTALLAAGILASSICLLGFGLTIGGLFKNANQLNTWSSLFLLPIIAPVFLIIAPLPTVVSFLIGLLPTGAAARIFSNGLAGDDIYGGIPLSFLVIALWIAVGYAAVYWQLRRRQA